MDSFTFIMLSAGTCFILISVYYLFSTPKMYVSKHGIKDVTRWKKVHTLTWIVSLTAGILLVLLSLAPRLLKWEKTLLFERLTSLIAIFALLLIITGLFNLNKKA